MNGMPHVFEPAPPTARMPRLQAGLQKGELRFGEALPNQFGEGEVTHWFHPSAPRTSGRSRC
jgi:hypothetical protein